MQKCKVCGRVIVRASMYDSDGVVPLYGGVREYEGRVLTEWWVCTNPECEEGVKNSSAKEKRK